MDISERKKRILRAVIDNYIETAEPVGSKAIAQQSDLGLSSATIRNEMSELEAMGFLEQPHTSAGRIPSPQGYRMYVNELMQRHRLSIAETEEINRSLRSKMAQLDRIISDAGRLTSKLTSYPAFAQIAAINQVTISRFDLIYVESNTFIIVVMLSNSTVKNKLVRLPFNIEQSTLVKLSTVFNARFTGLTESEITPSLISSTEKASGDDIGLVAVIAGYALEILADMKNSESYITGTSHIFEHPEFQDVGKAQKLLDFLSDDAELLKLPSPSDTEDIKISIGPENVADELKNSSVIVAKYDMGNNMSGLIGVVGPTRMDYSKVAAKLSYIAKGLSQIISGKGNAPPGKSAGKQIPQKYVEFDDDDF